MKEPEKRRAVWINDTDWAAICEKAKLRNISPSALIRAQIVGGGFITPESLLRDPAFAKHVEAVRAGFGHSSPAPRPSQKTKR